MSKQVEGQQQASRWVLRKPTPPGAPSTSGKVAQMVDGTRMVSDGIRCFFPTQHYGRNMFNCLPLRCNVWTM